MDPQQVASRATGQFQLCFPGIRPVRRPVLTSKTKTKRFTRLSYTGLVVELEHLKIKTILTNEKFSSVMGE